MRSSTEDVAIAWLLIWNLSGCDKTEDTISLEHVRLALYAISTVALVPAIIIFHIYRSGSHLIIPENLGGTGYCNLHEHEHGHFRSLQVTRISIHKNLFISLLLFTVTTVLYRVQVFLAKSFSSMSITLALGEACYQNPCPPFLHLHIHALTH